jgi:N-acetylglucosamine kinase-like BadF-type ATPase
LGIDPPTALTAAVLDYFRQPTIEEVLHGLTKRLGAPHPNLGGLTRILLDSADKGDPTARQIVLAHGAMLGDYALATARKVGIEGTAFPLVLTGGVLRHPSTLLQTAIVARVQTTSPGAQPLKSPFEPAIGALLLALEAAHSAVDEWTLAQIRQTMPPDSLFATG